MFFKIGVPKNFANFSGKHQCWSLFLIKLQALVCNFIKKSLQQRHFPVKLAKLLRTPIFTEQFRWLLLIIREICKFLDERFLWVATCCLLMFYILINYENLTADGIFFLIISSNIFLFFLTYNLKCLSLTPYIQWETMCKNIIWSFSFVTS